MDARLRWAGVHKHAATALLNSLFVSDQKRPYPRTHTHIWKHQNLSKTERSSTKKLKQIISFYRKILTSINSNNFRPAEQVYPRRHEKPALTHQHLLGKNEPPTALG